MSHHTTPSLSNLLFESNYSQHPVYVQAKAAPTYDDLVKLTKTHEFKTRYVGEGVTRWVYDLGDAVLKIEMPHSDTQNKSEVDVFECSGPEFFAEIYDYDRENYGWLVMEKLDTNQQNMRRKLVSYFGEGTYYLHIDELVGEIKAGLLPAIINRIGEYAASNNIREEAIRWVENFAEVTKRCDVETFDFHKGNVGLRRSTDQIVFLDYASYPSVDESGILTENTEHPLLAKVKAAKTREELLALTSTVEFGRLHLGSGDTRKVYDLGDRVLKVEKLNSNTQNKSEVEVFKCTGSEFFAEIFDYDAKNFWWLVMEKTNHDRKATKKKLVSYFGPASRYQFIDHLTYVLANNPAGLDDVRYAIDSNRVITSQLEKEAKAWVEHFAMVIKTCDVNVIDFHDGNVSIRPSTNQLVFHDYANYDLAASPSSNISLSEVIFSP